jgi:hypothetical protein
MSTNRLERVSRGVDEEETTMDPGIRDEPVPLSCKLLSKVNGILVLDLFIKAEFRNLSCMKKDVY